MEEPLLRTIKQAAEELGAPVGSLKSAAAKHLADNSQPPKAPETVTRYRNADLCAATGQAFADCNSARNANDTNALTPSNYQDIARTWQEPDTSLLRDLARVKALFQQRAIVAHLKGGA